MPTTFTPPRPADPAATYCHLCGAEGGGAARVHPACADRLAAYRAAEADRTAADLSAAYNAWSTDRRRTPR